MQHFEAMPNVTNITPETTNGIEAVKIENDNKAKPMRTVDGSKFETFFDAVVNILIIIPVK